MQIVVTYRRAGTEQIVSDIANASMKAGIRSVIAIPSHSALDDFAYECSRSGAIVERTGPLFESPRAILRNGVRLYRVARRHRPDVVHLHFPWAPTCFESVVAMGLARVPVRIRTEHNPIMQRLGRKQRVKLRILDRLVTSIVCVSSGNRDRHISMGGRPAHKIRVVLNGTTYAEQHLSREQVSDLRAELGLEAGNILVGFVGALEERKGILDLVRVAALVPADVPVVFVVAGDGPLRSAAEAMACDLGVEHRVRFLGHRSNIPELLAALDVFLQPSHFEGLSIAMLEAMGAGAPIITTAVDGVADVTAHCEFGAVLPIGDIDGLAKAVIALAEDAPRREHLRRTGSTCARTMFTTDRMCAEYLALYQDSLALTSHRSNQL